MLPSKPRIFQGREHELDHIVNQLCVGTCRVAILGPNGIGKTSLAKTALHHPDVLAKYQHMFFVPCDSASSVSEIVTMVAAHLGLKPRPNLTKFVIRNLSEKMASLIILDNLETAWEPLPSRPGVEEFLDLLTGIDHLSLMVNFLK